MAAYCKKPLRVRAVLRLGGGNREYALLVAHYHPRGCMHARENHLDIPIAPVLTPVALLARKRGTHIPCRETERGIALEEPSLGIELTLTPLQGRTRLHCLKDTAYIMLSRSKKLYIAPILLEPR